GEQANAVDGLAAAPDVDDILRELIDHIAGNVVAERVADVLALFVDRKVVEQHRPDQTEGRLQERDHHRVPDGLRGELVFGQAQVESVQSDGGDCGADRARGAAEQTDDHAPRENHQNVGIGPQ